MKLSKIFSVILAIVLLLPLVAYADISNMDGVELQNIVNDAKAKDKVLVVDVRSNDEYNAGHIKHAINIPFAEIEADPNILADYKDFPIILYCKTGKTSGKAAKILDDNGYKNITNAQGVKKFNYELFTYKNITAKMFLDMIDSNEYTIVDARRAEDYAEGHIKGAISVPLETLEANIDNIPKDKPVCVYCYSGSRSNAVSKKLNELGYEVYNVIDGTKEYDYKLVK